MKILQDGCSTNFIYYNILNFSFIGEKIVGFSFYKLYIF